MLNVNFLFLNILDILTTWMILGVGGREANPLFSHFNVVGIGWIDVVIKIGLTLGMCLLVHYVYTYAVNKHTKLAVLIVYATIIILNLLVILVVINNLQVLDFQLQQIKPIIDNLIQVGV